MSHFDSLLGKSLIETQDWSTEDLNKVIELAEKLEKLDLEGKDLGFLKNQLGLAMFFDKSTRTKASFAGAVSRLGARPVIVDGETTQISHGETPEETGAMLGMNAHILGIRHDKIIGEGNTFIRRVKKGADDYLKSANVKRYVPMLNLQCDIDHPTQSMADLMKIKETFGNLKGKKITVSWAYSPSYAKPLSVPQGLITLLTRFGMHVTLAHPPEYKLMSKCVKAAEENSKKSGGSFKIVNNMDEAFKGVDIVYPKSWGPYDLMLKRVGEKSSEKLNEIEKEMLQLNAKYKDWICDERKMSLTNNAHYMHCLPADLGAEVELSIYEKHKDFVFSQANKKMYIMMALIAGSMIPDLESKL